MGLKEDLINKVNVFYTEPFTVEETTIVPTTDYSKLTFGNKVLKAELTFLFVDIRKSSKIVDTLGFIGAARLYQSFHEITSKIIAKRNGQIRSFDGDRILGIFAGDRKNNNAVEAALNIRWAIQNILNPKLGSSPIAIGIGIDTGETLITKVGKSGGGNNSDIVWVGNACVNAALFCSKGTNMIYIGNAVKNRLDKSNLDDSDGKSMWEGLITKDKHDNNKFCFRSNYVWSAL